MGSITAQLLSGLSRDHLGCVLRFVVLLEDESSSQSDVLGTLEKVFIKDAFSQTPSGLSCAFYWGVASVWPLYHKYLMGGVLQRWLSFWKILPSPQRKFGALSEWPLGSWSPPWTRVLVVPNFFDLRMMLATVFLGTFNAAELFW